jgi:hypothetical protein
MKRREDVVAVAAGPVKSVIAVFLRTVTMRRRVV